MKEMLQKQQEQIFFSRIKVENYIPQYQIHF